MVVNDNKVLGNTILMTPSQISIDESTDWRFLRVGSMFGLFISIQIKRVMMSAMRITHTTE